MNLKLVVMDQQLISPSITSKAKIVADSRNYLKITFDYRSEEWKTGKVWALFTYQGKTYKQLVGQGEGVAENECWVPHEVIHAPGFKLSVYTGNRITTNSITLKVEPSGYTQDIENFTKTGTVVEQIDGLMKSYALICNQILQDCIKIKEEIKEEKKSNE